MNKEEKKEITLRTTVKAIITGYVSYGILFGFIFFVLNVITNWCINILPNVNMRGISITLPIIASFLLYFMIRFISKLSIHDVFKKCKTNPDNLEKVFTRLNFFIILVILVYSIGSVAMLILNFVSEEQAIIISSYQYKTIHSAEFSSKLTQEMMAQFAEEKTNTTISTIILELGMFISLISVIPLQKKLITEYNDF